MEKKYLILGQGLAGTILSMKMEEQAIPHIIIDDSTLSASSKVAAGIINPIVLKRFRMVNEAPFFLNGLDNFYNKWEKKLKTNFYNTIDIHHIFKSYGEQNLWLEKSEKKFFENYLNDISVNENQTIKAPFGLGKTKGTRQLNSALLIESYRNYLHQQKECYYESTVNNLEKLEELKGKYLCTDVILCNGYLLQKFLPQTKDTFIPTRGELLIIHTENLPEDRIYHGGVFILPLGNHFFKVGATYDWDVLNDEPTQKAKESLLNSLEKIYTGSYKIVKHYAGVRPTIKDRFPILGKLNDYYVFNGLGSRGALIAPQLANIFCNYLKTHSEIPKPYSLKRFT